MKMIIQMAVRNLLRQKRRNLLLAVIIAFAMAVLILASSIGAGMTDNMVNKIMAQITGHIMITGQERYNGTRSVLRDKDRVLDTLRKNIKGMKSVHEKVYNDYFARAVGNGKSANIFLDGVEITPEFLSSVSLGEGKIEDFTGTNIENAVILTIKYAKKLNVRKGDTISIRMQTLDGQAQTARLPVVGVMKGSDNVFMENAVYIKSFEYKKLMGYKSSEGDKFLITLKDTRFIRKDFARLYSAFRPEIACFMDGISSGKISADCTVLAFSTNSSGIAQLRKELALTGSLERSSETNRAVVSAKLAEKLGLVPGKKFLWIHSAKFSGEKLTNELETGAVLKNTDLLKGDVLLLNEDTYFKNVLKNVPQKPVAPETVIAKDKLAIAEKLFLPEWILFPVCKDEDEISKAISTLNKNKTHGFILKITTMYEEGSSMLQYSKLIDYITFFGVLILFFITQIGVVNTLRMTVRERTREIGTMRSIGMQQNQVLWLFILETQFLTFFASLAGVLFGFAGMGLLSLMRLEPANDTMSVFISNNHLHFLINFAAVGIYILVLQMVAFTSAYFPARKASRLQASVALRHYE